MDIYAKTVMNSLYHHIPLNKTTYKVSEEDIWECGKLRIKKGENIINIITDEEGRTKWQETWKAVEKIGESWDKRIDPIEHFMATANNITQPVKDRYIEILKDRRDNGYR